MKNGNESIMVSTRFFTFFQKKEGSHFHEMDIYKCPKPKTDRQTQIRVFLRFLIFTRELYFYLSLSMVVTMNDKVFARNSCSFEFSVF